MTYQSTSDGFVRMKPAQGVCRSPAQRQVFRARIVLMAHNGVTSQDIAAAWACRAPLVLRLPP